MIARIFCNGLRVYRVNAFTNHVLAEWEKPAHRNIVPYMFSANVTGIDVSEKRRRKTWLVIGDDFWKLIRRFHEKNTISLI